MQRVPSLSHHRSHLTHTPTHLHAQMRLRTLASTHARAHTHKRTHAHPHTQAHGHVAAVAPQSGTLSPAPRPRRRTRLEAELQSEQLSEAERREIFGMLEARERDFTRLQRQRMSAADFEPLTLIGRGAFGEVRPRYRALGCIGL